MNLTNKQSQALDYLEDSKTREVLYGGSAGGGKSVLGCYWQLKQRIKYPGTRGMIGRAKLKDLKDTTLMTFFEVAKLQNVSHLFKYNAQSNRIEFNNGSVIFLKDLFLYPSDPEFVGLGSLELTDAFLDEGGDISEKAVNILRTRIRFNLINGLPKLMVGANPAKNWIYRDYYKPFRDGILEPDKKFVPAKATDNPHIASEYLKSLDKLTGIDRERLRDGNWDYESSIGEMVCYSNALDMFTNEYAQTGRKTITADIATFGADLFVVFVWDGLMLIKAVIMEKSDGDDISRTIQSLATQYQVPRSRIVYDSDGVGSAIAGLRQAVRFQNGGSPIVNKSNSKTKLHAKKFANLKCQCAYKLAEMVNNGEIGIKQGAVPDRYKERILTEFAWLRQAKPDDDNHLFIMSKLEMKEGLGHSPDFLDAFTMRMYFEV